MDMRKKRQKPQDIPPYIVPLSAQAIEIVRYLLDGFKPAQRYLFRHDYNMKERMSENTLNGALKRIGFRDLLTGHGIRATLSTALSEFGYPIKWVDAQLSHADPNQVSGTYNHAEYVEQRRRMMQDWADWLDLFEQNQLEAASMPLTIHLEGASAGASVPAGGVIASPTIGSPLVRVSTPTSAPNASVPSRRLPAVRLLPAPPPSDDQRVRMDLMELFDAPHNLPVVAFAKLAGKSRRWISYEIQAGNLFALRVGNQGQRVPDWHLNPTKHALIQAVLKLI